MSKELLSRFRDPISKHIKAEPWLSILESYNRSYKTHFARMRNRKVGKEEFEQWKITAKEMKAKAINDEISIKDFKTWLKK